MIVIYEKIIEILNKNVCHEIFFSLRQYAVHNFNANLVVTLVFYLIFSSAGSILRRIEKQIALLICMKLVEQPLFRDPRAETRLTVYRPTYILEQRRLTSQGSSAYR